MSSAESRLSLQDSFVRNAESLCEGGSFFFLGGGGQKESYYLLLAL